MTNKKLKIIDFKVYNQTRRIPKSVSIKEQFKENTLKSIEYTEEQLKEIKKLLKNEEYEKVISYKEDILLKSKIQNKINQNEDGIK